MLPPVRAGVPDERSCEGAGEADGGEELRLRDGASDRLGGGDELRARDGASERLGGGGGGDELRAREGASDRLGGADAAGEDRYRGAEGAGDGAESTLRCVRAGC